MSRSIWKHNYIGKILPFEIKKKKNGKILEIEKY